MTRRTPKQVAFDILSVARLKRAGVPFPPVADPEPGQRTLLVGPTNSAGQGNAWARAAERENPPLVATSMAFTRDQRFAFAVDLAVPSAYGAHSRAWQRRQWSAVSRFEAVLLESGKPLFAGYRGTGPLAEIAELRRAGVRTALVFHGSDIRDPDAHLGAEPDSHFAADPVLADALRGTTRRNRELIASAGCEVFVSTPDLLFDVPEARWLPVVIDVERWAAPEPPLAHGGVPRVVHVPSSSSIKGSELIIPVLERLAKERMIEYVPVAGVPHSEMPMLYGQADIVIDQMRAGIYGVAACEALAAGRIVVSHVAKRVRDLTARLTGDDLPIVQADAATLEGVLREIVERPEPFLARARGGPAFSAAHHDGRRSGRVIADWLESLSEERR